MSFPFRYGNFLEIGEPGENAHCIGFSKTGDYVVLGTDKCITVWDIDTGKQLVPQFQTVDPSSITWINESSFVVGYRNGSLYTFTLVLEEQVRLLYMLGLHDYVLKTNDCIPATRYIGLCRVSATNPSSFI
jgi:WD40 repeat protein